MMYPWLGELSDESWMSSVKPQSSTWLESSPWVDLVTEQSDSFWSTTHSVKCTSRRHPGSSFVLSTDT